MVAMELETPREDELLTLREAAEQYGLSIDTMRDNIRTHKIPSWRQGKFLKIRRVDAEELRDRLRGLRRNG